MDDRFFVEISLRTKKFGCSFEGWDVFRGRRFQAGDIANQSVNLTPFGRMLSSTVGKLKWLRVPGGTHQIYGL